MIKSKQDFHRNAEEFTKRFCRRAAKMLKIRENPFFSGWHTCSWLAFLSIEEPKNDKIQTLFPQKRRTKTIAAKQQICLKLEKVCSFSARGAAKFGQRRTKINSLIEEKSGILRKSSHQGSLKRFHFLLYINVVIKPSLQWVPLTYSQY